LTRTDFRILERLGFGHQIRRRYRGLPIAASSCILAINRLSTACVIPEGRLFSRGDSAMLRRGLGLGDSNRHRLLFSPSQFVFHQQGQPPYARGGIRPPTPGSESVMPPAGIAPGAVLLIPALLRNGSCLSGEIGDCCRVTQGVKGLVRIGRAAVEHTMSQERWTGRRRAGSGSGIRRRPKQKFSGSIRARCAEFERVMS
jgi:hypothetical protein